MCEHVKNKLPSVTSRPVADVHTRLWLGPAPRAAVWRDTSPGNKWEVMVGVCQCDTRGEKQEGGLLGRSYAEELQERLHVSLCLTSRPSGASAAWTHADGSLVSSARGFGGGRLSWGRACNRRDGGCPQLKENKKRLQENIKNNIPVFPATERFRRRNTGDLSGRVHGSRLGPSP